MEGGSRKKHDKLFTKREPYKYRRQIHGVAQEDTDTSEENYLGGDHSLFVVAVGKEQTENKQITLKNTLENNKLSIHMFKG